MTMHPTIFKLIETYKGDISRSKFMSRALEYVAENYEDFNHWYSKRIKELGDTGDE